MAGASLPYKDGLKDYYKMSEDNVLKDPDFLFTYLRLWWSATVEKIELTEEDVLAVDMSEAVGLHYDRENSVITLKFVTAED